MSGGPHILVAVTGHGFGHAAQACVAVRALRSRIPRLRVTVQATLPRNVLAELFGDPVEVIDLAADPGLVMNSPFDVDVEASARAYAAFHEQWEAKVSEEARRLSELAPDLIISDVPYLPIAGAALAGIPAYALCSLNWADIYRHYCGDRAEAGRIHREILAAYRSARAFLIAEPGMPMESLANTRPIGPCARIGQDRRQEIRRRLRLDPNTRLVLLAMGGIAWRADLADWPRFDGWHFVVHADRVPARAGMSTFASLGMPMIDVVRSSDAVITKIGYGLLTEAACNGTALLYVGRDDWPEAPFGYNWTDRLRAEPIDRQALEDGSFMVDLDRLLAHPNAPPVRATGGDDAAQFIIDDLRDRQPQFRT